MYKARSCQEHLREPTTMMSRPIVRHLVPRRTWSKTHGTGTARVHLDHSGARSGPRHSCDRHPGPWGGERRRRRPRSSRLMAASIWAMGSCSSSWWHASGGVRGKLVPETRGGTPSPPMSLLHSPFATLAGENISLLSAFPAEAAGGDRGRVRGCHQFLQQTRSATLCSLRAPLSTPTRADSRLPSPAALAI